MIKIEKKKISFFLIFASLMVVVLIYISCTTVAAPLNYSFAGGMFVMGTDVYVAGNVNGNSGTMACYWLNGKRTNLDTESNSIATDIYVNGNDIYVSGYYYNTTSKKYIACYWINGVKTDLSSDYSYANSIKYNGSTVYIGGYSTDNTTDKATFWQNTNATIINTTTDSIITDIDFDTNIYSAGYITAGSSYKAVYLTNSTISTLEASTDSQALSIFRTSDSHTLCAGYKRVNTIRNACYWLDTTAVLLDSSDDAIAFACFAKDGSTNIYIGGYNYNASSSKYEICYWHNNAQTIIATSPYISSVNDIYVDSSDQVYLSGNKNDGSKNIGFYYKNDRISYLQ